MGRVVTEGRKAFFSVLTGVMLSFCWTAGHSLDRYASLNLSEGSFYLKLAAGSVLGGLLVYCLFGLSERERRAASVARTKGLRLFAERIVGCRLWCMAVLLVCWLPALLSLFPGAFAYDASAEWEQVSRWELTSHHPVAHVLWAGGLVEGMHALTGSYNAGIAVYTLMQMLLLAYVFASVIRFMKEIGLPVAFGVGALIFYGLSPTVQLFSISTTKDVPFSAALLMFFLYTVRFYCGREFFAGSRKNWLALGLWAFLSVIFRNNGLYVVALMLAVMMIGCLRRKSLRKRFAVLLGALGLLYGLYTGPVYQMLDIEAGGTQEMLSVPIQQMARVHKYEYGSLEQSDLDLLYQVIPKENLDAYRATVSDPVKVGFQEKAFRENAGALCCLWLKWGRQHPLVYISSFLINTVDFWYPAAVVDGYQDPYGKSSYFDYRVSTPGKELVILKGCHEYYERLSSDPEAQKKPFVFLLLAPGWYFVVFLTIFQWSLCYRRHYFTYPMLSLLLLFLTVLLGPMALVRYVLIFYYSFPVLISFFLGGRYYEARK